jgi:hypothetical protein
MSEITRRRLIGGSAMAAALAGTGAFFGPWRHNRAHAQGKPIKLGLIPIRIDQNPLAQSRRPMDMIVQGRSTSLFQASQQWSTRSA